METKNEIIERLIKDGHLKLDEALVLLDKAMPQLNQPSYPYLPGNYPQTIQPYYGDEFKTVCKDVTD